MTLAEALAKGTGLLDGAGRDARALLAHVLGLRADRLILESARAVSDAEWDSYTAMLDKRRAGTPVSRLIGTRLFWGRSFRVTAQVLDPRPETETLIEAALRLPPPKRLLDLGTGSGIIAITLLAERPQATGIATDLSAGALETAKANAETHGLTDRLTFLETSWFNGVSGPFDLITCNPPYIARDEMPALAPEVRDHDPEMALTPGGDGLDAYREIVPRAPQHLTQGGHLLVEIGPTQGPAVAALFTDAGLTDIAILPDLDGRDRVVQGRRP